jgi:hypothetical protein
MNCNFIIIIFIIIDLAYWIPLKKKHQQTCQLTLTRDNYRDAAPVNLTERGLNRCCQYHINKLIGANSKERAIKDVY